MNISPVSSREIFDLNPNRPHSLGVCKVLSIVRDFFRMVGLWFVQAGSWVKVRTIDLLPEETAIRLDPRRIFVRTILTVPKNRREGVLRHALGLISPQKNSEENGELIRLVTDENPTRSSKREMLRWITPEMHTEESIEMVKAVSAIENGEIGFADLFMDEKPEDLSKLAPLYRAIARVDEKERRGLFKIASNLFTPGMALLSKIAIFEAVGALSEEKRGEIVPVVKKFVGDSTDGLYIKGVVEALAKVPEGERGEVLRNGSLLIRKEIDSKGRIEIINSIRALPFAERDQIIGCVCQVVSPKMDALERVAAVELIAQLPFGEREEIVRNSLLVMDQCMGSQQRGRIIHTFWQIASDSNRDSVRVHALRLISEPMGTDEKVSFIEAVSKIAPDDRERVIKTALELFRPETDFRDRIDLIETVSLALSILGSEGDRIKEVALALKDLSLGDRIDIVKQAIELIAYETDPDRILTFIRELGTLTSKERGLYVECQMLGGRWEHFRDRSSLKDWAIGLLPNQMGIDIDPRRKWIEAISTVDPIHRGALLEIALPMVAPRMYPKKREELIRLVNAQSRQSSPLNGVLPWIQDEEMWTWESLFLLKKMGQILDAIFPESVPIFVKTLNEIDNLKLRKRVFLNAISLSKGEVGFQYIIDLIQTLKFLPKADREEISEFASRAISPNMKEKTRRALLELVLSIPASERAGVMADARYIFWRASELFERSKLMIIYNLTKASQEERNEIVNLSTDICNQYLWAVKYINRELIESLKSIEDRARRIEVFRCVLLSTGGVGFRTKYLIDLIEALKFFPDSDLQEICFFVSRAVTNEMTEVARRSILQAILTLPPEERGDVMEHAFLLFNDQMGHRQRVETINALAEVPRDGRERYVQDWREGRIGQNHPAARPLGLDVHADNRDQRVKGAILALIEHQNGVSKDEIYRGANQFIEFLYNSNLDPKDFELARVALLEPKLRPLEPFGPLIGDLKFSILGLEISGEELIGRLWIFASQLEGLDQMNVKKGMIGALRDSYEGVNRICNQGKSQMLAVAVLQGRLKGCEIESTEERKLKVSQALTVFFYKKERRELGLDDLLKEGDQFCDENPLVDREEFRAKLTQFAALGN